MMFAFLIFATYLHKHILVDTLPAKRSKEKRNVQFLTTNHIVSLEKRNANICLLLSIISVSHIRDVSETCVAEVFSF